MPRRNSTVEIVDGKVVFSNEVLEYFENIRTEENGTWVDKYFDYLSDESNLSAEKYNIHHIRPCFSFKDKTHKNRKETKPLADEFNGNLIKLSIYNHILAHRCLWKIFNNFDSKSSFQRMCGQNIFINKLTEDEFKKIAKLREECAKENRTDEEKKEYYKHWYENNKDETKEKQRNYYLNNREKILNYVKIWSKLNHEKRAKYLEDNQDRIKETNRNWYLKNKDKSNQNHKIWIQNNYEKVKEYSKNWKTEHKDDIKKYDKEYGQRNCFDPIKNEYCTLNALRCRKYHGKNKDLYKNVKPSECIIKN